MAVSVTAPPFTLPSIDGPPVSLQDLLERGSHVLVFAHGDCPTSALTLRRLAELGDGDGITCIFEEPPETAARLARRAGLPFAVLSEPTPYEVSRAFGVESVPTAIRIDAS